MAAHLAGGVDAPGIQPCPKGQGRLKQGVVVMPQDPAPTADPGRAGTAPVDPTNLTPGIDAGRMQEGAEAAADAAGAEGSGPADPIGGEATKAATAWGGESEAEAKP